MLGSVSSGGGGYLSLDTGLVHLAKESREEKRCEHPAGSISTGRGQGVEEEDAKATLVGKPPDPVSDLPRSQLGRASKPARCRGHSVGSQCGVECTYWTRPDLDTKDFEKWYLKNLSS